MRIETDKTFGTRECPSCATEVESNHNRCPICGYLFPQPTPTQSRMKLWGAVIMLILLAIMLLGLSL